jgi:hypothetical protein
MTSTNPIGSPALARTVRDVVSQQPELVNEVWCRKIFRHVLQLLERLHALRVPHLPISPDTIGLDAFGEPMLLPATPDTVEPGEADDVQALGAVIHFAITGESVPGRSLRARGLEGYSESLVAAVDRCTTAEPRERPQSIEELRNLLGIVSLGPAVPPPAQAAPTFVEVPTQRRGIAALGKWQRWLLIGLAAVVLLGTGSAFLMLLRGTDARDNVVLSLPHANEPTHGSVPADRALDPNESVVGATRSVPFPAPAAPGSAGPAAPPADVAAQAPAPAALPPARPETGRLARSSEATLPAAAPADRTTQQRTAKAGPTNVKLSIQPWGTVYVDGVERGVSPPLKWVTLTAGRHTVRIVNPNFRDRVLRVEAGKPGAKRIAVDFTAY